MLDLPSGDVINVNYITRLSPLNGNACMIHMHGVTYEVTGNWDAGGSGRLYANPLHQSIYVGLPIQEVLAKINNVIALTRMVERAAT